MVWNAGGTVLDRDHRSQNTGLALMFPFPLPDLVAALLWFQPLQLMFYGAGSLLNFITHLYVFPVQQLHEMQMPEVAINML